MTDTRRVIVTGATGMIGKRLFTALTGKGYAVVIFSRDPNKAQAALPGAAEYVAWTPAEDGPWATAIDGAHGVIHLAGAPISGGLLGERWTVENKARIRDSRVIGTRGIVNAMGRAERKPATFVCASAIGYYGYSDDTKLGEDAGPGNDFVAQVCVAWENEAIKAEALGIRTVLMRTGIVLDPDGGALQQLLMPFRMGVGGPIMPGTQWYSWIHPDDEIGLMMLALEDERVRGPFNAVAPESQMCRDFSKTIGNVLRAPAWLPVPEFGIQLALGEMADLVTKGQRVLPYKAQELGYTFAYPTLEPALRNLLGK